VVAADGGALELALDRATSGTPAAILIGLV
jgi:hypothetical protein